MTVIAAGRATGLPVISYLLGVARPLLACAVMFLAVVAVGRESESLDLAPIVTIALQIVIGAGAYVIGAFVLAASTAREFVRLARETLSRR